MEWRGSYVWQNFFYTCKAKGLNITLSEWLTLQEALDKGLCNSSLTQFYYVARMILVKSETDFDKLTWLLRRLLRESIPKTKSQKT